MTKEQKKCFTNNSCFECDERECLLQKEERMDKAVDTIKQYCKERECPDCKYFEKYEGCMFKNADRPPEAWEIRKGKNN